ncbi:MAG: T9SS type A sorting domain-containing protein [Paludibacteraceae bacterium]
MKKFTLIVVLVLCGLTVVQAQRFLNFSPKFNNETAYSQSSLLISDNEDSPKFTMEGKVLTARNLDNGTQVDVYSVLGAKVYSFIYKGNSETLNLNKGIYIIRAGKFTQKIIL